MSLVRAGCALAVTALAALSSPAAAAASPVPYADPAATGSIGLCDSSGHPVTRGSIHDKPFVWRAVGSSRAPAAYAGRGAKATLLAYQPRPGTPPDQWSGDTLTATSSYTNPAYPMAAATPLDFTLEDFLKEYPPQVDGLIQLRMYVGAPNVGTYTASYPATDIRITGATWTVARGASVACTNGSASSSETAPGAHAPPTSSRTAPPASGGTSAGQRSGQHPSSSAPSRRSSAPAGARASGGGSTPSSSTARTAALPVGIEPAGDPSASRVPLVLGSLAGLAVLGGGGWLWWRRRTTP